MNNISERGQSGSTLVEVALASALLLGITASIVSILMSFNSAEKEIGARLDGAAAVESALDEIAPDLAAADPVQPGTESASMDRSITVTLPERVGGELIRVERDQDGRLVRQVVDHTGVRSTRYLGGGGEFDDLKITYATASGRPLVPGNESSAMIARCSAVVKVEITARDQGERITDERTVALRNADPGAEPC